MPKKKKMPECCYESLDCKNVGNEDKCVECERNWDNWPDFNDNFESKDSSLESLKQEPSK